MVRVVIATILSIAAAAHLRLAAAAGEDLKAPPTLSSSNGKLSLSLRLEEATVATADYNLTTRAYNGRIPGPTLRLSPNDTLTINFTNALLPRGRTYRRNVISAPADTNLHFHGLFVSGELPSDDTTVVVSPGRSLLYSARLPREHMPGTHWLHPHRHGSTSIQVGGGAASAIIVQDPPNTLPSPVAAARDVLLFLQPLRLPELREVVRESADTLFRAAVTHPRDRDNVVLVNGQVRPVVRAAANEWLRLRVVHAGWLPENIRLSVVRTGADVADAAARCEMQLLAKDGIYIRDFPRAITKAFLPAAGRADVMVRCPSKRTTYEIRDGKAFVIAQVRTSDVEVQSKALPTWMPAVPEYLQDLTRTPPSAGCDCLTDMEDDAVNGRPFNVSEFIHESYLGAVVQRIVTADDHPYHQHVYPFQVVDGELDGTDGYVKVGDWHDTLDADMTIRYQPRKYVTKMMVHCHRLRHEDRGMMAIERVKAAQNATCRCTAPLDDDWVLPVAIGVPVAAILLIGGLVFILWRRRRSKNEAIADKDGADEKEAIVDQNSAY